MLSSQLRRKGIGPRARDDKARETEGLQVSGVGYAYTGITALEDVSLEVRPGEAVCIVGPNGAGKTTLAKVIAGIHRPRTGTVTFGGREISRRRSCKVPSYGVAIVLEGRHVFAEQSVRTNLELGAYWRRLRSDQMHLDLQRVFELFPDLERFQDRPAADLSGGQQQMLCVGRALMGTPKILILDEPSMGLSPKLAGELYGVLAVLRQSGLAILLIEQNAQLAFDSCTRGYVLQHGRVVLAGTVDELRSTNIVREIYLGVERLTSQTATNGRQRTHQEGDAE